MIQDSILREKPDAIDARLNKKKSQRAKISIVFFFVVFVLFCFVFLFIAFYLLYKKKAGYLFS